MSVQQTATRTLTLVVLDPLVVTTDSLPSAIQGKPYSANLSATGGQPPYTWSATGLPAGLTCSSDGVISGTPTQSGSFSVVITAKDSV